MADVTDPANLDTTCAQLVSLTNSHTNNDQIAKAHHAIRQCDLALRRYPARPRGTAQRRAGPRTGPTGRRDRR
jgi:hypothetical protein